MKTSVDIRKANVSEIQTLRFEVLWPHLNGPEECTIAPDIDETTFHIAAFENGKTVGTATFIVDINDRFKEKNQYRLRAMATAPEIRGYGVGALLVERGIEELKKQGIKLLWCDARLIATGFYEKLNFKIKGKVYQVPKIG
ncbi:GNAT family N-acetyltransferase, partial [Crocinitomix sp.]|nr:GNAT family N-acetyltransferase [Crocinitomix sp.]